MVTFERASHLSWMKAAVAQCLVPGLSMTFRSRCTVLGQSSRNEAKVLAMFEVVVAVSAGEPVPDALKAKRPREPPASCVCSRMSRLLRHSPPNLIVCEFISRVSELTTLKVRSERSQGWLGEKPRIGP